MGTSSKPQPPDRLWVCDRAALCGGDVILELGEGWKSWAISRVDGSPFSHALIWAGNTDFVESVGSGVRTLSFERVVIANPDQWLLLRQPDRERGERAALAARRLVGKYYNILGAVASVGPTAGRPVANQLFCSELVAQAYLDAGLDLVPGYPPHKVTPRLLLESPAFSRIALPVLECDPHSRERAQKLLDRDAAYEGSIMATEARVARSAFAEVEPLSGTIPRTTAEGVKNPPGNLHELIDWLANAPIEGCRTVMDRLLAVLRELGYFHLLDKPLKQVREAFIQAAIHLRFANMPPSERDALRNDILEQCRGYGETAQRHLRNALICEELVRRSAHDLWVELAAMHRRNQQQLLILCAMGDDLASNASTAT